MKFSTGGKLREPKGRTGEIPVATVKVWMEEELFVYFLSKNVPRRDILGTLFFV